MRLTSPQLHKATFILVAKQTPAGKIIPVQHVRYIRLRLSDQAVQDAGGWDALWHLPDTQTVALYLPRLGQARRAYGRASGGESAKRGVGSSQAWWPLTARERKLGS